MPDKGLHKKGSLNFGSPVYFFRIMNTNRSENVPSRMGPEALQTLLDNYWLSGDFERDLSELPADKRLPLMEKFLGYLLPKAGKSVAAPEGFSFAARLRNLPDGPEGE